MNRWHSVWSAHARRAVSLSREGWISVATRSIGSEVAFTEAFCWRVGAATLKSCCRGPTLRLSARRRCLVASKLGELVLGPMRLVTVYSAREALDKIEDRGGKHLMATTDGVTGYLVKDSALVGVNTSVADARRALAMSKLSDDDLQALGLTRSR